MSPAIAVAFATFLLAESSGYHSFGDPIAINPHEVKYIKAANCQKGAPYEKCAVIVYPSGGSHIVAGSFEEVVAKLSGNPPTN